MNLSRRPGREADPADMDAGSRASQPEPLTPPPIVIERAASRRDPVDLLLRILAGVVLLLMLLMLGLGLLLLTSLLGVGDRIGSGVGAVGAELGRTAESAAEAIASARQGIVDRFDPSHPPRGRLSYDAEIDALRIVGVKREIGKSEEYALTLEEVRRRGDAEDPNNAQFAVVKRRLLTPRETRVLGVVVATDWGEEEFFLYKGESFRLGSEFFKVNWVSFEQKEMALVRYRHVDGLTAPLKFQVD